MGIILVLIFACAIALGLALTSLGRRPEQRRLDRLASGGATPIQENGEGLLRSGDEGFFARLVRPLGGDPTHRSETDTASLRARLSHAGYRRDSALITYTGSRYALALALPVVFLLTPIAWTLSQVQLAIGALAAAGLGLVFPSYWLDRKVKARQKALTLALPDALDLMVVCVEAGLGINASLKRIADDFRTTCPVLAEEFELANFETRAGKSTTDALRGLAVRTGVTDVSTLVAMLIQTERFGTGLADTLRVHADAMRVRRLQRAEEAANKAPLKMLFPTVFIFVAMLIIIVGPAFIAFKEQFSTGGG